MLRVRLAGRSMTGSANSSAERPVDKALYTVGEFSQRINESEGIGARSEKNRPTY